MFENMGLDYTKLELHQAMNAKSEITTLLQNCYEHVTLTSGLKRKSVTQMLQTCYS